MFWAVAGAGSGSGAGCGPEADWHWIPGIKHVKDHELGTVLEGLRAGYGPQSGVAVGYGFGAGSMGLWAWYGAAGVPE